MNALVKKIVLIKTERTHWRAEVCFALFEAGEKKSDCEMSILLDTMLGCSVIGLSTKIIDGIKVAYPEAKVEEVAPLMIR